jgi:hypothetical protein
MTDLVRAAGTSDGALVAASGAGKRRYAPLLRALPLAVILTAQAVLSGSLIHLGIASAQEGQYIYAGHQLIHELWHGEGSPYYETYFGGAPILYPVLAAMADAVGGLAAARLMSLVCMLIATILLYAVTRRIFGLWPAVIGAAMFAALGVSQWLGAEATPDAMTLMLISAAAYCAVRAADDGDAARRWLVLIPITLVAADATKYAAILFDPVVIGIGALLVRIQGWRRVGHRALALSCATATMLALAILLAGTSYLKGIWVTVTSGGETIAGQVRSASGLAPVLDSWHLVGIAACIAAAGVALAVVFREQHFLPLLTLLTLAAALPTLGSMRLHSLTSLGNYDDFGVWFACVAAGYALGRLAELVRSRIIGVLAATLAVTPILVIGLADDGQAAGFMTAPNSSMPRIQALERFVHPGGQHYLISSYYYVAYELHPSLKWQQVTESNYIKYPVPGHHDRYLYGIAGFTAAIQDHWFAVVSFPNPAGPGWDSWDRLELQQVRATAGYQLISSTGGPIYIYRPYQSRETR